MSTLLKVAYAGTPDLAATILQRLLNEKQYSIECVFTQPDRAAGRGRKIRQSPVKVLAESKQIDILQPEKSANMDPAILDNIDVMVVAAYGLLLPDSILHRPRLGCINVHTSLLPRWRGAAPIQRAIQAGDEITGITIMQMDSGLDTGKILLQSECPLESNDTAGTLHDRLAVLGGEILLECLEKLAADELPGQQQDNTKACYAEKITRAEAEIDWHRPALEIERKVRAFNPSPVCHTTLNGLQMRIWETALSVNKQASIAPGEVTAGTDGGFKVMCADGFLQINKLQLPGKKPVMVKEFLNGHKDFLDRQVES